MAKMEKKGKNEKRNKIRQMLATLEGLGSGGVVAVRKRSPENTINDIIVIPGLRAPPLHPPSPPPLPTVIARPTKRPAYHCQKPLLPYLSSPLL